MGQTSSLRLRKLIVPVRRSGTLFGVLSSPSHWGVPAAESSSSSFGTGPRGPAGSARAIRD